MLAGALEQEIGTLTSRASERLLTSVPELGHVPAGDRIEPALRASFGAFVRAWAEDRLLDDDELDVATRWFDLSDEGPPRSLLLQAHRVVVDVVRDAIERLVGGLGSELAGGPDATRALLKELGLARSLERQLTEAVEHLAGVRERRYATERASLEERAVAALLDLPADVTTARAVLRALGCDLGGPWTLALLPEAGGGAARARAVLRTAGLTRAAAADRPGGAVLLVNDTPDAVVSALAGEAVAGIGRGACSLSEVRLRADEASAALQVSVRRGCGPVLADRAELDLLLLGAVTPTELVDRMLAPLSEVDDTRREWMLETLEAYLDAGTSVTAAGRALSLHRESVRYRIAQLRDLFAGDLDDPDRRLALHLAVKALRHGLSRAPASPAVAAR